MSKLEDRYKSVIHELVQRVSSLEKGIRKMIADTPLFDIANENTPGTLLHDQNDYEPGSYDVLRLSSDAARTITGIARGKKGRNLRLFNIGPYPITLKYESTSSAIANRFKFSNGLDAIIPPSSTILIYYDSTNARWIGGDTYSSGAVYMEVANATAQSVPETVPTKIDPGSVVSDQYGFYDGINNRILFPFPGAYQITYTAVFAEAPLAVEYPRFIGIYVNGGFDFTADLREQFPNGANVIYHQIQMVKTFATGDYIEFYATHLNAGNGAINLNKVRVTLLRIA